MARFTTPRSVVGGTTRFESPAKATSATLNRGGSRLRNSLAAVWAASMRLGFTSSAIIERDTSIATTTVARSRGTLV